MAQSDIQSYLQQLSGIHTTSQANVPGAVNNGNPNTVYNNPPGGGYLPPVSNALDQWRINPGSGINWQQLAMQGGFGGQGGFNFNLGGMAPKQSTPPAGWHPSTGGGGWPGTPGTGGGTGGIPSTGTGGGIPPTPRTGGNHDPGTAGGGGAGGYGGGGTNHSGGADWYDFGGDRSSLGSLGFSDHPTSPNDVQSTSAHDPAGWGNISDTDLGAMLNTGMPLGTVGQSLYGTPIGQAFGIKSDGSISLGQVIDFFVPGNIYMGQTGKVNLLNAIPGLAAKINPALGTAVRAAMNWLANHTKVKALKNWQKMNQDNKAAGRGGGGGGGTGGGTGGTSGLDMFGGSPSTTDSGIHGTMYGNPLDPNAPFLNDSGFGNIGTWGNPMSMFDFHDSDTK